MMRSLYSGISGLRNHQTRMDVIANNISNVNTAGFVASRVVFKDVFSQTSSYAAGATNEKGGVNPIQIGLGMSLATIDMLHGGSTAFARSDRELDFAISGEGFFVVNINDSGTSPVLRYSRAGNFYWDNDGNLVNGDGYFVMGVEVGEVYNGTDQRVAAADADDLTIINASGYYDISIDVNGNIIGFSEIDDEKYVIANLVMGTFENTNGLEKVGNSLYKESNNSGTVEFKLSGEAGAGEFMQGGLEMSNVDLATEFTDMIVTQRGFQANSRIITTSDSMLEELVNLKR